MKDKKKTSSPPRQRPPYPESPALVVGLSHGNETEASRTVAMLPVLAASLITAEALRAPATTASTVMSCPDGVHQQLDGLYRWQVQRMDQPNGPAAALSSQRDRFTPGLFNLLLQARQLTPSRDGRYLDIDVFSNTQARTFGAVVTGCSAIQGSTIQAAVDVQYGLGSRASTTPRRLLYDLNRDSTGNWRIAEITYLDDQAFQLKPYLQELLNPTP